MGIQIGGIYTSYNTYVPTNVDIYIVLKKEDSFHIICQLSSSMNSSLSKDDILIMLTRQPNFKFVSVNDKFFLECIDGYIGKIPEEIVDKLKFEMEKKRWKN